MNTPPGWRLVPSRSRQQQSKTKSASKLTVLTYENVFTGERFTQPPTQPAKADLPSELFTNHVQIVGEQLVQQQIYQMGCLLRDSKILHHQQQNSTYVVQLEELSNESASLVGSALAGQRQDKDIKDINQMMRVGESLYSAKYQAELLTYSNSIRQIVKNSISQIEIVHGRQVERLQNLVEELTIAWHSGSSNAELHECWMADATNLHILDHWHQGHHYTRVKGGPTTPNKSPTHVKRKKRGRRQTMIGTHTDMNFMDEKEEKKGAQPFQLGRNINNAMNPNTNTNTHEQRLDSNADDWDDIEEEPTEKGGKDAKAPKKYNKTKQEEQNRRWSNPLIREKTPYFKPKYDGATFFEPHSIQVKDQLEIVYQSKYQKELINKVQNEFREVKKLILLSRKKRLNVMNDGHDELEEKIEEEEEDAAENVEYLKNELKLARLKLHFTNSEVKMTQEKLKSIHAGTTSLRTAYQSWNGVSPIQYNQALAPHICFEVGYKTNDGENKYTQTHRMKGNSMSHLITLARRHNLATYIATGGDGKTKDDDENAINDKLKAARKVRASESKSAQMAARTGFVSPSMKKMFMLSLAYEVGGGQTGNSIEKDKTSLMSEFGGIHEDPKFKRMQSDRYRTMMNVLTANQVPNYVLSKFKTILDEHEISLAKAAHTHTKQHTINNNMIDIEEKLVPLNKEFEDKLRELTHKHNLDAKIIEQILHEDKQAMNLHLRPALKQVIRVVQAMKRFEEKGQQGSHANSDNSNSSDSGDGGGGGGGSGGGGGGGGFERKTEEKTEDLDVSNWNHDYRIQRIDRKSKSRLAKIFQQHRVRANIASLLQAVTQEHHAVVTNLLLSQQEQENGSSAVGGSSASGDASHDFQFQQKVAEASEKHSMSLSSIKKQHNLSNDLINDISISRDLHHIHIMQGDSYSTDTSDEDTQDDLLKNF